MKQLGTKWQFNFFVALMTSWSAFELFCNKQYNKKMLQQYIHKFFPRITEKKTQYKNNITKEDLYAVDQIIKRGIANESMYYSIECLKILVNASNFYETLKKHIKFLNSSDQANNILHLRILFLNSDKKEFSDRKYNLTSGYSGIKDGILSFIKDVKERYEYYETDTLCITSIRLESSRRGSLPVLTFFKNVINECYNSQIKKNKKHDYVKKDMNVGIEFEIESIDSHSMTFEEMETIVDKNIISLSSGIDGNYDTENNISKNGVTELSRYENVGNSRINEDRIRLNGYKGLKGLDKYISYAKKRSALSPSSSIHIHIDCLYDDSYKSLKKKESQLNMKETFLKFLRHSKQPKFLEILDLTDETKQSLSIQKKIKLKNIKNSKAWLTVEDSLYRFNDLNTLEFRTFKQTLDYEDVVCYILIASYITKCFKQKEKIQEKTVNKIIDAWLYVKKKKAKL